MTTLRFLAGWTEEQTGDIRAGDPLQIEYDAARLPGCRSERYGRPAWSIAAYLRFHPDGQVQSGGVVDPLQVDVPAGSSRVEMWFKNTDQTGCVAWDSRYGQNYWRDVVG